MIYQVKGNSMLKNNVLKELNIVTNKVDEMPNDLSSYWTEKELKIEGKPVAIFNAFRQYQMESVLFRVFVKLGWRK